MRLYNEIPKTWQEFEQKIAKILNECGYKAEVEKKLMTVRGSIVVDVFVETEDPIFESFICECKFWNTPVTKEKVLAFRAVVQDVGSPIGILLSKNGFQSGAIEAAKKSNVLLWTFDEFFNRIADQWLEKMFIKLEHKSAILSIYTDPLDIPYEEIKEENKYKYKEALEKYVPLYLTVMSLNTSAFQRKDGDYNVCIERKFYAIESFDNFVDYLAYLNNMTEEAILEFEKILVGVKVDQYKIDALSNYSEYIKCINCILLDK